MTYETRWGHKSTRICRRVPAAQRERKRLEAIARNTQWESMSTKDKLAYLDRWFHNGAKRQRKRLQTAEA